MAFLLCIESSGFSCSAAIYKGYDLVGSKEGAVPQSASSTLAPLVKDVLDAAGIKPNELDGVAVSAGPGSYTGLRIGASMAKGISFSLEIPLIGVSTLKIVAQELKSRWKEVGSAAMEIGDAALLCPMIDARRMEVYCQLMDWNLNEITPVEAKIIDQKSFSDYLTDSTILFFGNGAEKCGEVLPSRNAFFLTDINPWAKSMGVLAFQKYETGQFVDISTFEPTYLKDYLIRKPKAS